MMFQQFKLNQFLTMDAVFFKLDNTQGEVITDTRVLGMVGLTGYITQI